MAAYVPPYRVDLIDWCDWTDNSPDKIRGVVGTGFRLPGPMHSVYTMAANAILRLIEQYDIDPQEVRYLALGTESSTDNSAGAVIIRGMVDEALMSQGQTTLSRNCEVPEFKHACLGGVYALKNALRFLQTDGVAAKAIVVCSDIALYAPGSSGEPTQGAGAVAMLLETNPQIASFDLRMSGSASDYRGVDFRKPIQYRNGDGRTYSCSNVPVFNGRYSASCYIDEMMHALEDMCTRRGMTINEYLCGARAVFMHRPFKRMPENGWGIAWLISLAATPSGQATLENYCLDAGVDFTLALAEATERPKVAAFGVQEKIRDEVFPELSTVLRHFRQHADYHSAVTEKMRLGTRAMEELGNLYTGALPAWLAAGLEEASTQEEGLAAGDEILLVGYGSGDAAEAIPATLVTGWQAAAQKIDMGRAMDAPINLSHEQYLSLRNEGSTKPPAYTPKEEFIVERVGTQNDEAFQDAGVEYYRFVQ